MQIKISFVNIVSSRRFSYVLLLFLLLILLLSRPSNYNYVDIISSWKNVLIKSVRASAPVRLDTISRPCLTGNRSVLIMRARAHTHTHAYKHVYVHSHTGQQYYYLLSLFSRFPTRDCYYHVIIIIIIIQLRVAAARTD